MPVERENSFSIETTRGIVIFAIAHFVFRGLTPFLPPFLVAMMVWGVTVSEAEPRRHVREREEAVTATQGAPGAETLIDLIDVPTAEVVRYGNYDINFRFYSGGGVLTRLVFGVFRPLNLGGSWDVRRLIGSEDATPVTPRVFGKWRVFDGGPVLPALALGFDGQGFLYDGTARQYRHREKGLYVVGSAELFVPGLELHGGVNMYDFDRARVLGFIGGSWRLSQAFVLVAEYDNLRMLDDQRVNVGLRYQVVPPVHVEVSGRDLGHPDVRERVLRISYLGTF